MTDDIEDAQLSRRISTTTIAVFLESVMRVTLLALGAFFFLAYPLVLLLSVMVNVELSQQQPKAAAIHLTARSSARWLEDDPADRSPGLLRNGSIRKSDN